MRVKDLLLNKKVNYQEKILVVLFETNIIIFVKLKTKFTRNEPTFVPQYIIMLKSI